MSIIIFNESYDSEFEINDIVIFKHNNRITKEKEKYIGVIEDIGFEKKGNISRLLYYIQRIKNIEINIPECWECPWEEQEKIDEIVGCKECKKECHGHCEKFSDVCKTCKIPISEKNKEKYMDWCRTNPKTGERFVVINYKEISSQELDREEMNGKLGIDWVWVDKYEIELWDGEFDKDIN